MMRAAILLLTWITGTGAYPALAQDNHFELIAYHVTDPAASEALIRKIGTEKDTNFWVLTGNSSLLMTDKYRAAAETAQAAPFKAENRMTGTAGFVVLYRADKFAVTGVTSPRLYRTGSGERSPFVLRLRERAVGREFLLAVNSFYAGNREKRHRQASKFKKWAETQPLPVIAAGDFQFEWNRETGRGDRGFRRLTRDHILDWLRPENIAEICTGQAIQDFVFLGGGAQNWFASGRLLAPLAGDCGERLPLRVRIFLPV